MSYVPLPCFEDWQLEQVRKYQEHLATYPDKSNGGRWENPPLRPGEFASGQGIAFVRVARALSRMEKSGIIDWKLLTRIGEDLGLSALYIDYPSLWHALYILDVECPNEELLIVQLCGWYVEQQAII